MDGAGEREREERDGTRSRQQAAAGAGRVYVRTNVRSSTHQVRHIRADGHSISPLAPLSRSPHASFRQSPLQRPSPASTQGTQGCSEKPAPLTAARDDDSIHGFGVTPSPGSEDARGREVRVVLPLPWAWYGSCDRTRGCCRGPGPSTPGVAVGGLVGADGACQQWGSRPRARKTACLRPGRGHQCPQG